MFSLNQERGMLDISIGREIPAFLSSPASLSGRVLIVIEVPKNVSSDSTGEAFCLVKQLARRGGESVLKIDKSPWIVYGPGTRCSASAILHHSVNGRHQAPNMSLGREKNRQQKMTSSMTCIGSFVGPSCVKWPVHHEDRWMAVNITGIFPVNPKDKALATKGRAPSNYIVYVSQRTQTP
ncbi:hypothetical protein PoB_001119300 [Plakobranchus ocellatus]|uniref:Uncharacterized protein n=1 Tax=Plakobranchus ocellatus TaxID=259542 RepID=A0AAV3YQR6_9GAST|nr:hypothetical protein PoB_001119300 [Plakobranchus ocellatus]